MLSDVPRSVCPSCSTQAWARNCPPTLHTPTWTNERYPCRANTRCSASARVRHVAYGTTRLATLTLHSRRFGDDRRDGTLRLTVRNLAKRRDGRIHNAMRTWTTVTNALTRSLVT